MGFRFTKRIKIAPGVRLNVSRKGVSTSIGVRGASVNIGHGKTRITTGIPGTGISSSTSLGSGKKNSSRNLEEARQLVSDLDQQQSRRPNQELKAFAYWLGRAVGRRPIIWLSFTVLVAIVAYKVLTRH